MANYRRVGIELPRHSHSPFLSTIPSLQIFPHRRFIGTLLARHFTTANMFCIDQIPSLKKEQKKKVLHLSGPQNTKLFLSSCACTSAYDEHFLDYYYYYASALPSSSIINAQNRHFIRRDWVLVLQRQHLPFHHSSCFMFMVRRCEHVLPSHAPHTHTHNTGNGIFFFCFFLSSPLLLTPSFVLCNVRQPLDGFMLEQRRRLCSTCARFIQFGYLPGTEEWRTENHHKCMGVCVWRICLTN